MDRRELAYRILREAGTWALAVDLALGNKHEGRIPTAAVAPVICPYLESSGPMAG